MRQYEVTFVIDPVLPKNEIQEKAKKYIDMLKSNDCEIVNIDEMGLRQLAYGINRRNSGVYYCVEFQNELGAAIDVLELEMRRDEELLRFLTVSLDKFGVKYNADKRAGLIGTIKKKEKEDKDSRDNRGNRGNRNNGAKSSAPAKKEAPAKAAPAKETVAAAAAPVAETPAPKVEEATPVVEAVAPEATATAKDDLKKVEGVGPKIEQLMNEAGILTFAQMAAAGPAKMKEILTAAGTRFNRHDPTTWGDQAQMAADGKWDELKKWQDEMDGGKATSSDEEE